MPAPPISPGAAAISAALRAPICTFRPLSRAAAWSRPWAGSSPGAESPESSPSAESVAGADSVAVGEGGAVVATVGTAAGSGVPVEVSGASDGSAEALASAAGESEREQPVSTAPAMVSGRRTRAVMRKGLFIGAG